MAALGGKDGKLNLKIYRMWKSPDRLIQVKSSLERYKLIPGVFIMKEGDTSSPITAAPRSGEGCTPEIFDTAEERNFY
jgi:hypothetical protein